MSSHKFVWAVALLAVCIVTVAACPSYGELVPIVNAGFESPAQTDGNWGYAHPGWGWFANGGSLGNWNPDATGAIFYGYGGNAPEGQNVGWTEPREIDNTPDDPDDDDFSYEDGGFAQVLTETLTVGMTYTLTVEVGNSYYYSWAGYKVQLLAGGGFPTEGQISAVLLAEDDSSVTIANDTFETSTVTYTYDSAHSALLGQPLQIRLLAVDGSMEVDFDDVKLDAVPEPATMGLLGIGALCLILGLIRRKRE